MPIKVIVSTVNFFNELEKVQLLYFWITAQGKNQFLSQVLLHNFVIKDYSKRKKKKEKKRKKKRNKKEKKRKKQEKNSVIFSTVILVIICLNFFFFFQFYIPTRFWGNITQNAWLLLELYIFFFSFTCLVTTSCNIGNRKVEPYTRTHSFRVLSQGTTEYHSISNKAYKDIQLW